MANIILSESSFTAHVGFLNHYEYKSILTTDADAAADAASDVYLHVTQNPKNPSKNYIKTVDTIYKDVNYETHKPILKFENGNIKLKNFNINRHDPLFKWIFD